MSKNNNNYVLMYNYLGLEENNNMWKDLTLSQKADIIKMAVKQGMRSINDIQSFYDEVSGNSGRFKDGGDLDKQQEPILGGGGDLGDLARAGYKVFRISNEDVVNGKTTSFLINDPNRPNYYRYQPREKAFGGNLFDGTSEGSQQMQFGPAYWQQQVQKPIFTEELAEFNRKKAEEDKQRRVRFQRWAETKGKEMAEKRARDYTTTSNDNTWVGKNNGRTKNPHLTDRAIQGAKAHRAWVEEHPVSNAVGLGLSTIPFVVAASPILELAGEAFAGTTLAGISAPRWTDAALTAGFAAHGLDHAINEGINGWGDAAMTALEVAPLGMLAKPIFNKAVTAIENYIYPLGRPQLPENFLNIKPQVRTKVGDVEIDNPNLLYHLDRGDGAGAFSTQGAYIKDGFLFPGTPKDASATPYSWWNKGKPYATAVQGQPMTRLMTTTEDTPGMLHIRSQNYPIGQWNGKRGLVTNAEYANPEKVDVSGSTYTLDTNYGWRKVFPEETPVAEWAMGKMLKLKGSTQGLNTYNTFK